MWFMPCCALTHHRQGYLPLKVLEIAVPSEACWENSIVIRTQANACSATHWPPLIAKTAQRHAASPRTLKVLCTAICCCAMLLFPSLAPRGAVALLQLRVNLRPRARADNRCSSDSD